MRTIVIILLGVSVLGCRHGGIHRKGERMASVRMHGSAWPIVGHAIAWEGEEGHEYYGAGLWNHWFTSDRIALGGGISLQNYHIDGTNVGAVEFEANYRHYLFEHEEKYAYFWEFYGGAQIAEFPVPRSGTTTEFTFAFGPGMEVKLGEKPRLLGGVQFHHQSNALGREAENNPSQNDLRVWLGFGWMW
ncbi:MAG: hypothetical protein ACYTHK_09035 [Planctomycetota bacterium]|jgi:hypothetical protein